MWVHSQNKARARERGREVEKIYCIKMRLMPCDEVPNDDEEEEVEK